ncbi:sensor histidine kinase [Kribbella sp. DT2]|uniref:sensor histidine kinase n=1 Tax=Kribbella sp. DT2 TaxID=3393427 RepID=UPI003CEC32ED
MNAATGPDDVPAWELALPVLPYVFLLLPATFALLDNWRPSILLLTLLALAWTAALYRPAIRLLLRLVYLAGMLAILAFLVHADPLFSVTGVGLFLQVFTLLPGRLAYAGVAATAAILVLARPRSGDDLADLIVSFLIAVLIASATGLLFTAIANQSEHRRQLIAELRRTTTELAALAEQNAELQARLLTSAREAGVLGERQRMAREIHDTIAQGLTGIVTQTEAAEDDPATSRARLSTIGGLARESLAEARRSIHALRPGPLQDSDFAAALEKVVTGWSKAGGVPATLTVTGEPVALHNEVESTLLRVAQEALANITKHANATQVVVTLSYLDDVVALDLHDNGNGFTPAATQGAGPGAASVGGFGLVVMRQRVARLAGSFVVESAPDRGTAISATVPAIPPTAGATE